MLNKLLYRLTLGWVNRRRASWGDVPLEDLPVGVRAASGACPLHGALQAVTYSVGGYDYALDGGQKRFFPFYVVSFIRRFDKGQYPELAVSWAEYREMAALSEREAREAARVPDPVEPEPSLAYEDEEDRLAVPVIT